METDRHTEDTERGGEIERERERERRRERERMWGMGKRGDAGRGEREGCISLAFTSGWLIGLTSNVNEKKKN